MPDTFYMLHTMFQESKCQNTVHSELGFVIKISSNLDQISLKLKGPEGFKGVSEITDGYPEVRRIRYAKAGTDPAKVTVKVFDTKERKDLDVDFELNDMIHIR